MRLTGGELVVRALEAEGISCTFGIPGTHNIELYDALEPSSVRPILVTDEQSAGFMADGYWRASGKLGCVNLVPGAGFTHALSGVAEAYMDGVPMLVLGCGIRQDVRLGYQLHDIDQLAMAAPVTKGTFRPLEGRELYRTIREACRLARAGTPGPVMVEVPVNLYLSRHEVSEADLGAPASIPPPTATGEQLDRAAKWLSEPGTGTLLHVGLGAAGAGDQLVRLAERLGAPVTTTIQGKGVFPESHPLFVWNGFGNSAPPFARAVAQGCDRILTIGCRFSEVGTAGYGITLPGPMLHVDINPEVLGRNFPAELGIVSDAAAFVAGVLERLPGTGSDRSVVEKAIADGRQVVWEGQDADQSPDRVSPMVLVRALQRVFGPETVFTTDSGNGTFLAMEGLVLERPGRFLAPVDYSCMGYSVPAAIGAALSRPGTPVVALAGDGAFLMTGLELLTAANQGIPVLVVVLRDRELAQIAQFQGTAFNRPVASRLPDYDLAGLAVGMGIECLPLRNDGEIGTVLASARERLEAGMPVMIDAAVDYSARTWFTKGVVKTMLGRLPWPDRLRFVGRALVRKVTG
ncbi:MAG: thiamine pyrophosphate-binding protein [Gemmatimonadota bacterium]